MVSKYDLIMKVKFCKEHRKYFEEKISLKLSDGSWGINPFELGYIIGKSENCLECEWCTTFPILKKLKNK